MRIWTSEVLRLLLSSGGTVEHLVCLERMQLPLLAAAGCSGNDCQLEKHTEEKQA